MLDRPLFVTRKFPPSVGGMETLAAETWRMLEADVSGAALIANRRANRNLVWWLPVTFLRVAWRIARRKVGFVLCGDALTFAVLEPLLRLGGVPSATMVMGLDVTFPNALYRRMVGAALRRAELVIAISDATAQAAVDAGAREGHVEVLRLGVAVPDPTNLDKDGARRRLVKSLGIDDDEVVVISTLGRLVRRKGVQWFIDEVLPELPGHVHLVVAGDGEEAESVRGAAGRSPAGARVHLLGRVDDITREDVMRGADVFVQPNVRVVGDMEGFGLVTVEAAVRGTVVVASSLEGIEDAVVDGETGILLPPEQAAAWVRALAGLIEDPRSLRALGDRFRAAAVLRYGSDVMGAKLVGLLDSAAQKPPTSG